MNCPVSDQKNTPEIGWLEQCHPPAIGKIPAHGSDAGSYLVGEVFGARSIILIKDVDEFIPPIRRPTPVPSSFRKSARSISFE